MASKASVPAEEDLKKTRIGRNKLRKPPRKSTRLPSTHVPDRFRYGDDAQEDVSAPKGGKHEPNQYMYQSVFSMIAAAGSRTDFNARLEDESSESEGEEGDTQRTSIPARRSDDRAGKQTEERDATKGKDGERRRSLEHKLLRSLPKLHLRSSHKSSKSQSRSASGLASPEEEGLSPSEEKHMTPQDAPVMSRMLEAEAEFAAEEAMAEPSKEAEVEPDSFEKHPSTTLLATRLMEIFGFEEPEKVISEYPCWLLQSVLLQGYMYITQKHICFYAYLPKKSNVVAKSGHLSKRGKSAGSKYNRYWFTLKGDVLSYYHNPGNLYFPHGTVDLRYGISASISKDKGESKDPKDFTVTTDHRTYHFRADSAASAKEWVKTLQKVIFRSHNDGDSVKLSLPIENVIDVEESPVIDFAETFKLRIIASDESYAIDEYFFSFFSFGKEAMDILQAMVDDSPAQKISAELLSPLSRKSEAGSPLERGPRESLDLRSSPRGAATPVFHDSVKATLLISEPRSPQSGDVGRSSRDLSRSRKSLDLNLREYGRASFDRGRRSGSTSRLSMNRNRMEKSPLPKGKDSSDSYVQSTEVGTESSLAVIHSTGETLESASQILSRSNIFQSPTINRLQDQELGPKNESREPSVDTARSAEVRIEPPTRAATQQDTTRHHLDRIREPSAHSETDNRGRLVQSNSSPTLQELVKAGAYPLQRAAGFAGYLKNRSKKMSSLLATESMGYIEKVSGMWQGGGRHYGDAEGALPYDDPEGLEEDEGPAGYGDRFRAHFALPETERLQATYFGYLHRVLPLYGKIYISNRKFCFRSLLPGMRTKMILPLKDIENVDKEKGFRFGYHGLVIVIRGHEELFFEFSQAAMRDDCAVTLHQNLESTRYMVESGILAREDQEEADAAKAEHQLLQEARQRGRETHELEITSQADAAADEHQMAPILFDDPRASILNFKPTESLRITCLTIGSRGDVQPYIALCKGLLAEGHRPKIATHAEFEPWVRKHGIDFAPVAGDPAELMRICVENGMFTFSFLKEASIKFRAWIDELLTSAWTACQDSDLLIESPSAMAGIHIAEALEIPYFRAFGMPWTRTRAYPHAFAVPEHKMGGAYNIMTYILFDNVFWKAIAGQVNRWRKKDLRLRGTNLDKLHPNKVPFLYNFSPSVVVPPLDYSDWIRVTGYWFLDEASDWTPPRELTDFIAKARKDEKKIVYIGFGSIVVSDPVAMTKTVVDSVLKADVRCILAKGWSDRLDNKDAIKTEVPLPPEIFQIKSAPHDWLFKQIDAAAHHGGAGTTGASLRAGLPTIVKPFFGDQYFFGSRVEDLGVGICIKKLNVSVFSRALWEATRSDRMIVRAKVLGDLIRKENGVETAINAVYRDLEYAKTLIKHRVIATSGTGTSTATNSTGTIVLAPDPSTHYDEEGNIEESWTFIGDESDPELVRRIAEWNPETAVRDTVRREPSLRKKDSVKRDDSRSRKRLSLRLPERRNSSRGKMRE